MDQMLSWVLVHHCITNQQRARREARAAACAPPPPPRRAGWIRRLRAMLLPGVLRR